ncbi:PREDICTED: max-like protein X isoform X2 [Priapulus caudatus]|uniref:Max-like protein X isoform X2 n=1 Tax=Priapulus caudatus TaxID=37621 RepID=A0ABM1DT01_PRICU|nr:PREDICTED: max-like protein X isoform X2 [Priapulus caudatus]
MAEAGYDPRQLERDPGQVVMTTSPPPPFSEPFVFSRNSSVNSSSSLSQHASGSSAPASDDDDSDHGDVKPVFSAKERRREAHQHAEQKRRDAIRTGYRELQEIVPTCASTDNLGGTPKLSNATVLQKSIDYIQFLMKDKKRYVEQVEELRKEVITLEIMKANYERIVKAHQNVEVQTENAVSDEAKFQVFQRIMDVLYQSFNNSVSVSNFAELSGCVFNWLEEHCKPGHLRSLTSSILQKTLDFRQ